MKTEVVRMIQFTEFKHTRRGVVDTSKFYFIGSEDEDMRYEVFTGEDPDDPDDEGHWEDVHLDSFKIYPCFTTYLMGIDRLYVAKQDAKYTICKVRVNLNDKNEIVGFAK